MQIFESIFDILYLGIVIALGIRLLFEKNKEAKLFGVMAMLLGIGDSFHLIPRVISHLSPGGFKAHAAALSWGQFITSITMTVFYVLYYIYYKNQSGDKSKVKDGLIYSLAIARILLVLMPQNNWGHVPGNYIFGIYRNIPFLLMGILLIYWSFKNRNIKALKNMDILIALSFIFYIPVVLFSQKYPVVGALMMPKTVAYLLIVYSGYKYFIDKFESKNILGLSFTYLLMGLILGAFYREFTKFYGYTNKTHLDKVHPHTIILGFVVLFLIYLCVRKYTKEDLKKIQSSIYVYITGLVLTISNMFLIGIYEVVSEGKEIIKIDALNGISGIGHIILLLGTIMFMSKLYRMEETNNIKIENK